MYEKKLPIEELVNFHIKDEQDEPRLISKIDDDDEKDYTDPLWFITRLLNAYQNCSNAADKRPRPENLRETIVEWEGIIQRRLICANKCKEKWLQAITEGKECV